MAKSEIGQLYVDGIHVAIGFVLWQVPVQLLAEWVSAKSHTHVPSPDWLLYVAIGLTVLFLPFLLRFYLRIGRWVTHHLGHLFTHLAHFHEARS